MACCGIACTQSLARTAHVILYATSSLQGRLWAASTQAPNGLLTWGALVQSHRSADGDVLWLHSGPLLEGSLEGPWLKKGLYEKLLCDLGPAVWNAGSIEEERLLQACKTHPGQGIDVLCPDQSMAVHFVDGVRMAFVALPDDEALDAVAWLNRQLQDVWVEQPDVLVVLSRDGYHSHGSRGTRRLNRLVARFPEVHVWLGEGRRGQAIVLGPTRAVVLTAPGGAALGRIDVAYDTVKGDVLSVGTKFYTPSDEMPLMRIEDAQVRASLDFVKRKVDQVVCDKPPAGWPEDRDLVGAALCKAGPAQIALFSKPEPAADWPASTLTRKDLWARFPGRSIPVVLSLTAAQLRRVMEERADLFLQGLSLDNGIFTWVDGRPLHGRARVRVVVDSSLINGPEACSELTRLAEGPEQRKEAASRDMFDALQDVLADTD